MTTQEKFNQILSILPDDGSSIDVVGAPLCTDNNWIEHSLRSLRKELGGYTNGNQRPVLKYRTKERALSGTIDIQSEFQSAEYEKDTEVLWLWLKQRGYFGDKIDKNLF